MMKYAMLAGAMTLAAPALAQTTASAAGDPTQTTAQPAPTPQPAQPATQPTPTPTPTPTPATGSAIVQTVEAELPTYDKDGNGTLSQAEFGTWMVALKTKADPATKADSAETKTWNRNAFAQADTDRNATLVKAELIAFLSQGQ